MPIPDTAEPDCAVVEAYADASVWAGVERGPVKGGVWIGPAVDVRASIGARFAACHPTGELPIAIHIKFILNTMPEPSAGGELEIDLPITDTTHLGFHAAVAHGSHANVIANAGLRLRQRSRWLGIDLVYSPPDGSSAPYDKASTFGVIAGVGGSVKPPIKWVVIGTVVVALLTAAKGSVFL